MRLNKRKPCVNLTDTNVSILSLGEAVKRWRDSGQFLMTEVNHTDSFESVDVNIKFDDAQAMCVPRIEAVLRGLDFVKEVHATSEKSPEVTPEKSLESSPEKPAE